VSWVCRCQLGIVRLVDNLVWGDALVLDIHTFGRAAGDGDFELWHGCGFMTTDGARLPYLFADDGGFFIIVERAGE